MSNSSIRSIDRTLSGSTTPGQSRPRRNGNEEVFLILQISKTEASDCFVTYPRHLLKVSCLSAEMQSVDSTAPAGRAIVFLGTKFTISIMIRYRLVDGVYNTLTVFVS